MLQKIFQRRRLPAAWAVAFALTFGAASARAENYYYVTVFGSQSTPNCPNHTHTFAAFVKATGAGPCPQEFVVEDCISISWLPRSLKVRSCALCPECGVNLPLKDTIEFVLADKQRLSVWGPFQIEEELYNNAKEQIALLASGRVRYKAIDSFHYSAKVSNCIHAVSACAQGNRLRIISPGYGETASWFVTRRFRPWIVDQTHTVDWVYNYLDLDEYPIVRRPLGRSPRTNAFWGMINVPLGLAGANDSKVQAPAMGDAPAR